MLEIKLCNSEYDEEYIIIHDKHSSIGGYDYSMTVSNEGRSASIQLSDYLIKNIIKILEGLSE